MPEVEHLHKSAQKGGEQLNANSVWNGHEYAYVHIVRRKYFPGNAVRVKVLSKREVQSGYKTRKDTYATVTFPDNPERGEREVNVRNLYDFWDSYVDEKRHVVEKRQREEAERNRVWQQQMAERAAAQAERDRQAQENREKLHRIRDGLARELAIDPESIQVNEQFGHFLIYAKELEFLAK